MNISSHHIQNVIRAYGQRVERRSLAQLKAVTQPVPRGPDSISISSEARQRQVTQEITSDMFARAGKEHGGGVREKIIERLGSELGGKIDILKDKGKKIKFRVITPDKDETVKELTPEHITKIIEHIYGNMVNENTILGTGMDHKVQEI